MGRGRTWVPKGWWACLDCFHCMYRGRKNSGRCPKCSGETQLVEALINEKEAD